LAAALAVRVHKPVPVAVLAAAQAGLVSVEMDVVLVHLGRVVTVALLVVALTAAVAVAVKALSAVMAVLEATVATVISG
jgi:hypothetical protein